MTRSESSCAGRLRSGGYWGDMRIMPALYLGDTRGIVLWKVDVVKGGEEVLQSAESVVRGWGASGEVGRGVGGLPMR